MQNKSNPFITASKNKKSVFIVLALITIIGIILAFIIVPKDQNSTSDNNSIPNSNSNSSTDSPPPKVLDPTNQNQQSPELKLVNAANLTYRAVNDDVQCSSDSIIRKDKKSIYIGTNSSIQIVSPADATSYDSKDLAKVDAIIQDDSLDPAVHTAARTRVFDLSCYPYQSIPFLEITNMITYPNVDSYRIFLSGDGRDGFPNLNMVLFAKKDGYYLAITSSLRVGNDALEYFQDASDGGCDPDFSSQSCLDRFIVTQTNKELVFQRAQETISLYQLENN